MSTLNEEELETFRRLQRAMGDARDEFVIAGGQASRLLRLHPDASPLEWEPILTNDIDVATKLKGHRARANVGTALTAEGFAIDFRDPNTPPVTHYVRGAMEVEFIVPSAAERHASGGVVTVLGINAQKVDNLDLVLEAVVEVDLPGVGPIRVPSPAAYILQKALTLTNRRSLAKKGKDSLYIHDAFRLFTRDGHLVASVVTQARELVARVPKSRRKILTANIEKLASSATDFVVEASRQAEGRAVPHTPAVLAAVMKLGFAELLDGS